MTSQENPVPAPVKVEGPAVLMALACNNCRTVYFSRSPEETVAQGLEHVQACGGNSIVLAELVIAAGT